MALGVEQKNFVVNYAVGDNVRGMIATILVITLFMPDSLEYACCAIVIGSVVSEILSCLFVFLLYYLEKRRSAYCTKRNGGRGGYTGVS